MGLSLFGRSFGKTAATYEQQKVSPYDPNPGRFEIIDHFECNGNLVISINYPNCINYEGNKIILFRNKKYLEIKNLKEIDPHFTEKSETSPFARFEPTRKGWYNACLMARLLK